MKDYVLIDKTNFEKEIRKLSNFWIGVRNPERILELLDKATVKEEPKLIEEKDKKRIIAEMQDLIRKNKQLEQTEEVKPKYCEHQNRYCEQCMFGESVKEDRVYCNHNKTCGFYGTLKEVQEHTLPTFIWA